MITLPWRWWTKHFSCAGGNISVPSFLTSIEVKEGSQRRTPAQGEEDGTGKSDRERQSGLVPIWGSLKSLFSCRWICPLPSWKDSWEGGKLRGSCDLWRSLLSPKQKEGERLDGEASGLQQGSSNRLTFMYFYFMRYLCRLIEGRSPAPGALQLQSPFTLATVLWSRLGCEPRSPSFKSSTLITTPHSHLGSLKPPLWPTDQSTR